MNIIVSEIGSSPGHGAPRRISTIFQCVAEINIFEQLFPARTTAPSPRKNLTLI